MLARELAIVAVLSLSPAATARARPARARRGRRGRERARRLLDALAIARDDAAHPRRRRLGGRTVVLALVLPGLERRDVLRRSPASGGWPRSASPWSWSPGSTAPGARSRVSTPCSRRRTAGRSSPSRTARRHRRLRAARLLAVRRRRPSLRLLAAEAIAAVGMLVAASLLLSSAPARGPQFARSARPIVGTALASGNADDLLVDVSAAPNRPGQNFVTATVLDTLRPPPAPGASRDHDVLARAPSA